MGRRIMWSKDGTWFSGGNWPEDVNVANPAYANYYDAAEYNSGVGYNLESCFGDVYNRIVVWNFPDVVSLDEFRWSIQGRYGNSGVTMNFESCPSGDTSNGIDGTWETVGTPRSVLPTYTHNSVALTAPSTRWFRFYVTMTSFPQWIMRDWTMMYMSLYGAYDVEDFVLWDNETVAAPIDDWNNYLTLPNAPDHEDFVPANKQFKIQNVGLVPHTYTITLNSGRNPFTDALILDNWTASKDGGATTGLSVQTTEVAVGSFSEVIDLEYFLAKIANPKDGYHWFRVLVKEDII